MNVCLEQSWGLSLLFQKKDVRTWRFVALTLILGAKLDIHCLSLLQPGFDLDKRTKDISLKKIFPSKKDISLTVHIEPTDFSTRLGMEYRGSPWG